MGHSVTVGAAAPRSAGSVHSALLVMLVPMVVSVRCVAIGPAVERWNAYQADSPGHARGRSSAIGGPSPLSGRPVPRDKKSAEKLKHEHSNHQRAYYRY